MGEKRIYRFTRFFSWQFPRMHAGGATFEMVPAEAAVFDAPPLAVQSHLKLEKLMKRFGLLKRLISLETMTGHVAEQLSEIDAVDLSLVDVSNPQLQISALKKAEEGKALIVRLYNAGAETVEEAEIVVEFDAKKAI